MSKEIIVFGEVLLRLSPPNHSKTFKSKLFEVHYGGAEANVGASLSLMGLDVNLVSSFPENDLGASAKSEMLSYGMKTTIVEQGERIGTYYYEHGASDRPGKVLYDRNHSSFSLLKKGMIDWKTIFKNANWFHFSGITPALSQDLAEVCEEALIIASEMGLTISADLNYRPSLWKYGKKANEVMPSLIKYCNILLGGADDSENCLNIKTAPEEPFESVYTKWQEHYPNLKTIVSTLRFKANASSNSIAAVLWSKNKLYRSNQFNVTHIIDRIGAGDAFMAGLIYGLTTWPDEPQKTVEYAIAASCLKHSIAGDINLSTINDISALMDGATGGRVIR
ncbi:sugar kinase [Flavobacterium fluviatile]|uniref:sugar kinase n=1 Tax=Flavobacterium fluviatile TaxID=1862387 RepID=UPI0013D72F2A|nr:sugar kinase [Flavobacterium fluviatile]